MLALLRQLLPGPLAAGILIVLSSRSVDAERTSSSGAPWQAEIEATFFEDGELAADKLGAYHERIEQRYTELSRLLAAAHRVRGADRRTVGRRLRHNKTLFVHRILLGDARSLGLLGRLWDETDPDRARVLASRILEIDYALRFEGERSLAPRKHVGETVDDRAEQAGAPDSSLWRSGAPIAARSVRDMLYRSRSPLYGGAEAGFPDGSTAFRRVHLTRARPYLQIDLRDADSSRSFRLTVGSGLHAKTTVDALLATLGFNTAVTRYVRDLRIDFDTPVLLENLRRDWETEQERRPRSERLDFEDCFIEGEDGGGRHLIVREGVLEWTPREVVRVGPWPFDANGHEGRREVRGLAVVSEWVGRTLIDPMEGNELAIRTDEPGGERLYHVHQDTGHSLGVRADGRLAPLPWDLSLATPGSRAGPDRRNTPPLSLGTNVPVPYADARWMTAQIAQLTKRQIAEAIAIGGWPRSVGRLLGEKLASRRNQLVLAFDLVGATSPSGAIGLLPVDRAAPDDARADADPQGAERGLGWIWSPHAVPSPRHVLRSALRPIRRAVAAVGSGDSHASTVLGPSGPDGPPAMLVHFVERDPDTSSEELRTAHLSFIDHVARAGQSRRQRRAGIAFTPELHSESGQWGHVVSETTVGFTSAAFEELLELDADEYWQRLAVHLGREESLLRRDRDHLRARGKDGMTRSRRVPRADQRAIRHSIEMMRRLEQATRESDAETRRDSVVAALSLAVLRRERGFDPRVLAALRDVLGASAMPVEARISQRSWERTRFPDGIDLVVHTRAARMPRSPADDTDSP